MKNSIGKIGIVGTLLVSGLLCDFGAGVNAKGLNQTRNDTESNIYHQPINVLKTASNIKNPVFRQLQMIGKMPELHTAIQSLTSIQLLPSFKH